MLETKENRFLCSLAFSAALVAQLVKNLPAMWQTRVQSLGGEDPLEKRKATLSLLENAMDGPWGCRVGHG